MGEREGYNIVSKHVQFFKKNKISGLDFVIIARKIYGDGDYAEK